MSLAYRQSATSDARSLMFCRSASFLILLGSTNTRGQKMKDNKDACNDLADHIGKLVEPIYSTLHNRASADVDLGLKQDLERLHECVQLVSTLNSTMNWISNVRY